MRVESVHVEVPVIVSVRSVLRHLRIDVLDEHRGRLIARCPNHQPDNHPSWSIVEKGPERGLHACWSCQFSGGLWRLVAHVQGYTTDEDEGRARAMQWLDSTPDEEPALRAPKSSEDVTQVDVAPPMRRPMRLPAGVITAPLEQWVTPARRYAVARNLEAAQIDQWGLGYAVDGRLQGRIVVPVRDQRGKLANYMARDFTGSSAKRYLYPSKHEGVDPRVLFGEQWWPAEREHRDVVYVTEGALNALAVERALGACWLGAIGGASNVNVTVAAKLSTFGRVVVLTDADDAGDSAAKRLASDVEVIVPVARVRLPRDADELFPAMLRAYIEAARDRVH